MTNLQKVAIVLFFLAASVAVMAIPIALILEFPMAGVAFIASSAMVLSIAMAIFVICTVLWGKP